MRNAPRRVLSLVLASAMLFSSTLPVFAEDAETLPEEELPVTQEIPETPEEETPAEASEETPEEAQEPAEKTAEPEEAAEEALPAEAEEEPAETAEPEENLPEEDAPVFPGMGENYVLSAAQKADKADLAAHNVAQQAAQGTPGEDYIADEVLCLAGSEEEALAIAAGYGAELASFEEGIAVLTLPEGVSVADALAAAEDLTNNLPAVDVNEIIQLNDPAVSETLASDGEVSAQAYLDTAPTETNGSDWMDGDPYLASDSDYYQWYHSAIHDYAAWGVTQGSETIRVAVLDSHTERQRYGLHRSYRRTSKNGNTFVMKIMF